MSRAETSNKYRGSHGCTVWEWHQAKAEWHYANCSQWRRYGGTHERSTRRQQVGYSIGAIKDYVPEDWEEVGVYGSQQKFSPYCSQGGPGTYRNSNPRLMLCSRRTVQSPGEGACMEVHLTGACKGPNIGLSASQFPPEPPLGWHGHCMKDLGNQVYAYVECCSGGPVVEIYANESLVASRCDVGIYPISVKVGIYISEGDLIQVVLDGVILWTSTTSCSQSFVQIMRPGSGKWPEKFTKVTLDVGGVGAVTPTPTESESSYSECSLDDLPALQDLRVCLLNVTGDHGRLNTVTPQAPVVSIVDVSNFTAIRSQMPALPETTVFDGGEAVHEESECASESSYTSYQSGTSHNSWVSASGEGAKCFLPGSLFLKHQVQEGVLVQAALLEQGSMVVAANGDPLKVAAIKKHMAYQLVELKTGGTRLIVTPNHRVLAQDPRREVLCSSDLSQISLKQHV